MSTTAADRDLLSRIGAQYGSEKVARGFCAFYDRYLRVRRKRIAKVLEIGIFSDSSLRMWRDHFPNARVHALDLPPVERRSRGQIAACVGERNRELALAPEAGFVHRRITHHARQ